MKVILFSFMLLMMMGISNCSGVKYGAPLFQDCTILTEWSEEKQIDTATCFCIDERVINDKTHKELVTKTSKVFNQHPLHDDVIKYLTDNKDFIIKHHEYELPISYCRGNTSVDPADRTALTKWAETNRLERIKCEME